MTEAEKAALQERLLSAIGPDSRRWFKRHSTNFLNYVGDGEVDAGAVRGWIEKLKAEHYADGTVLQAWSVVRRLFILNHLEWPFHRGDSPMVREQQIYQPRLAPHWVRELVGIVRLKCRPEGDVLPDARHTALLCLSTVWGFRREEMAVMEPAFLDIKNRLLFVATVKRGRQRWHVLPDFLIPPLLEWGFEEKLSLGTISDLFTDLKKMISFTGREVGWHAIRRAAIEAAWGFTTEPKIHTYYRWKKSRASMALRYATSQMVGPDVEQDRDIGATDREIDELFYAKHPFVDFWR
ncbi:hypothetical protein KKH13_04975 [Patescibacteria group bacterium]|nr:hypothetical protein [Patescibacteria group bacterium]